MADARIAVIIPVYRAHYLAECLASVVAQTRRADEIIVVDDGSPDGEVVQRAVRQFGDRVTLLRQENLGAGAARNRGILSTDAELIAFLDADDVWAQPFLEKQVARLTASPELTLVYANAQLIGDGPLRGLLFMDRAPSCGAVTVEALLSQRCTVITSSVVARRQAIVDAGLFDESLRRGQDFDMWVRLAAGGARIAFTTEPLLYRRIHANNLSGDRIAELQRAASVLAKLATKLALDPAESRLLADRVRALEAEIDVERGKRSLTDGDIPEAREQFRRAARAHAGWKTRLVSLALQVAPQLTRQAWLMKTRRQPPAGAAPATLRSLH